MDLGFLHLLLHVADEVNSQVLAVAREAQRVAVVDIEPQNVTGEDVSATYCVGLSVGMISLI